MQNFVLFVLQTHSYTQTIKNHAYTRNTNIQYLYSEQEKTDKNVKRIIAIHMFLDFFHKNILNKKIQKYCIIK